MEDMAYLLACVEDFLLGLNAKDELRPLVEEELCKVSKKSSKFGRGILREVCQGSCS